MNVKHAHAPAPKPVAFTFGESRQEPPDPRPFIYTNTVTPIPAKLCSFSFPARKAQWTSKIDSYWPYISPERDSVATEVYTTLSNSTQVHHFESYMAVSRLFSFSQKEVVVKIPLMKSQVASATVHRFCWSGARQQYALLWYLNVISLLLCCDDSVAWGKQDQIHQSRPDLAVSMNHKQDNDRLLIDEQSGQSSQSPSKYSVGNTGEPEKDTHFSPPPPPPWKRGALIVLICFLFYLGFSMRSTLLSDKKHDIVYVSR